jgi:hypothetical protein
VSSKHTSHRTLAVWALRVVFVALSAGRWLAGQTVPVVATTRGRGSRPRLAM